MLHRARQRLVAERTRLINQLRANPKFVHFRQAAIKHGEVVVLKNWRAAGRDLPVLILTARGAWVERSKWIDAGILNS